MAQVLYLKDTKDRYMSEDEQTVEDYKLNYQYHRLLRKYCGPNAYSVFTALIDRANDKEFNGWSFPSYELLMEDTGIGNRNAITAALELLFDMGLIEWQLNGRHAIYHPVKKMNSTELILFQGRAEQYQNNTKDSIKTVRSIVSKRYSNVNQLNVNQKNEIKTTPNGVGEPPSAENDFEVVVVYQSGSEPEQLPDALLPDTVEAHSKQTYPALPESTALTGDRDGVAGGAGEWDKIPKSKARDKPTPKPKKEPDPRSNHPAIAKFHEVFSRYPKTEHYQAIIDRVGENPIFLTKWGGACDYWMLGGWNYTNAGGLLDCFEKGSYTNGRFYPQQRRPDLARNGVITTYPAISKSIKPRGSSPDGGFSRSEFLEEGY